MKNGLSKVPAVTLGFWIIKILATTLGETGGDALSMTLNLGYAVSSLIFAGIFAAAVVAQIRAKSFHPVPYWIAIVATTTLGTTMADFADRSLGIGYTGGSAILFALLLASLGVWHRSQGSVAVDTVTSPKVEMFYWVTILFSQTLGTALGGRYQRIRFRARRARVLNRAGAGRGGVFPPENLAHRAVLVRLYPDAAFGRDAGRPDRQAGRARRICVWALLGIGNSGASDRRLHPVPVAEIRTREN